MLVSLRYNLTNGQDSADWINSNGGRLAAFVLTEKEVDTLRLTFGGLIFKTDRTEAQFLAALKEEGFSTDVFKAIVFRE